MRLVPPPPEFETVYIEGGWRAVERVFGKRPNVVNRFKHFIGREELEAKRLAYMKRNNIEHDPDDDIPWS